MKYTPVYCGVCKYEFNKESTVEDIQLHTNNHNLHNKKLWVVLI